MGVRDRRDSANSRRDNQSRKGSVASSFHKTNRVESEYINDKIIILQRIHNIFNCLLLDYYIIVLLFYDFIIV